MEMWVVVYDDRVDVFDTQREVVDCINWIESSLEPGQSVEVHAWDLMSPNFV